jgi:hypothetical protein
MICPQCGKTVDDSDAFCMACGSRLPDVQMQQQGQPQMSPVQQVQLREMAPTLPGSKMLRVCSILYIIIGALSIIVSLAAAASVHGTFTTIGIILLIFVDGGAIVSGIIGLALCKRPSAAAFFIAVGIAFIPLWVVFLAYGGGASLGMGVIVLAILYIVGGAQLGKSRSKIHHGTHSGNTHQL